MPLASRLSFVPVVAVAHIPAAFSGARAVGVGPCVSGGLGPGLDVAVDSRRARVAAIEATLVAACCVGSTDIGTFAAITAAVACKQQFQIVRSR